jgi:hypothetical protein
MIRELRKLAAGILNEIIEVLDPQPKDALPRQLPIGTLWYKDNGDCYRVGRRGLWEKVEQDGEPLDEPLADWERLLLNAYEGLCYEDECDCDCDKQ